jgi:hypothetical protein
MAHWAHKPGELTSIIEKHGAAICINCFCIIISIDEGKITTLDSSGRISLQTKKKFIIRIESQRS